ncbi:MAG: glycosyltransferase family 9 protein [Pseudomonadota bacterium]
MRELSPVAAALSNSAPSIQSICLFRLSALGDVCHCIALVRALQTAFPLASITWVIGQFEHRLVSALPNVEFIVFDKRSRRRGRRAFRKQFAGRQFDVLLLAQVSIRSGLLSRAIKARRRIGFDKQRSREGHGWFINERIQFVEYQHQADAMLEFARVLGASAEFERIERAPPIVNQDRAFALEYQPEPGKTVLISPCSSHPARNWTVSGYAEVADWLIERLNRPVILIGGPSALERDTADRIVAAMRHTPINLVGKDTLGQALAMLARAACLIAPDSGPVHLADALGTPVVGLYASTWSRRSGPHGSLIHCVDRFGEAAQRFRNRGPEQLRWGTRIEDEGVMQLIQPADVIERLQSLLVPDSDQASVPPT